MKDILKIPRSQQNGFLILFIVLLIISFFSGSTDEIDFAKIKPLNESRLRNKGLKKSVIKEKLFFFDPNIASEQDLLSLGFPAKTVKNIISYRDKGGRFFVKSDLKKIYTLTESLYTRLEGYINIPKINKFNKKKKSKPNFNKKQNYNSFKYYDKEVNVLNIKQVDLNLADTTTLQKIPKIGVVRSRQIVKYRTLLGGFYNLDQLKEVYSLESINIMNIKPFFIINQANVKKIDLNLTTIKELSKHPYLNYKQSKDIIEYRQITGKILKVENLLTDKIIDTVTYFKISNYLRVD